MVGEGGRAGEETKERERTKMRGAVRCLGLFPYIHAFPANSNLVGPFFFSRPGESAPALPPTCRGGDCARPVVPLTTPRPPPPCAQQARATRRGVVSSSACPHRRKLRLPAPAISRECSDEWGPPAPVAPYVGYQVRPPPAQISCLSTSWHHTRFSPSARPPPTHRFPGALPTRGLARSLARTHASSTFARAAARAGRGGASVIDPPPGSRHEMYEASGKEPQPLPYAPWLSARLLPVVHPRRHDAVAVHRLAPLLVLLSCGGHEHALNQLYARRGG